MPFTIRITKDEVVEVKSKEYMKIADTGNEHDGKTLYGYVPSTRMDKRETELYKQTIEALDLLAVISAANGLTK